MLRSAHVSESAFAWQGYCCYGGVCCRHTVGRCALCFRIVTKAMPVIKYQEFMPHTVLQDDVKRFWILEKEYTTEDSIEEVIPDACIELILNFGSAYIQLGESDPREL